MFSLCRYLMIILSYQCISDILFFFFFFFQAEDGIRDAQESRGLGDVYKRQVLEGRYVYPELIVKVLYETLASMETHAINDQSHTQAYLDCLAMGAAGTAAGGSATPAYGHLLALWMHQLSTYWPGTSVSAHVPLDEKEAISLLRSLYNVNAGTIKFPLDDMVGDLLFSTGNNVSKALAREYFANGVAVSYTHLTLPTKRIV
eukprot:TRINITY_DN20352_c0_g1_i5.p1 TRINITY_DN20352_c0_g1~~TRINITY_DN20352_c0_g1_i5.p1  ORF type:complete len:202 (-),score=42.08 TRINITY_DN20352_c0_g1_i5:144-749(-)